MNVEIPFNEGEWVLIKELPEYSVVQVKSARTNDEGRVTVELSDGRDTGLKGIKKATVKDKMFCLRVDNAPAFFAKMFALQALGLYHPGMSRLWKMLGFMNGMDIPFKQMSIPDIVKLAWTWYMAQDYMGEFENEWILEVKK